MNPRLDALHSDQKIQKTYGREGYRREGKNEEAVSCLDLSPGHQMGDKAKLLDLQSNKVRCEKNKELLSG